MKIVIIEDEPQAAERIERLLGELMPEAKVVDRIDTVKRAVQFFNGSELPDLALMDIQLADGISFDIFQKSTVRCPVIFITAYDEYAVKAFKVNSVDYLLKPLDKDEFNRSLDRFRSLHPVRENHATLLGNISEAISMLTKRYKTRFIIKVGEHLKTVETRNILFFYSQEKTTFCTTIENRSLILDHTLEQLEEIIDPELFFRINRKFLVSASAITDIIHHSNSRLKLKLRNCSDSDVVVARERVQEFKAWLDR